MAEKVESKDVKNVSTEHGSGADDLADKVPSKCYTNNDLIELVRAIKFANQEASIRTVHNEITQVMAKAEGYGFLEDVKLNDVKKVWKKALAAGPPRQPVAAKNREIPAASSSSEILKFYTVGDGSVQTLAENYTLRAAELAAEEEESARSKEAQQQAEEWKKYVHCFLDVPADRSGKRPYQALINFNDNRHCGNDVNAAAANRKKDERRGQNKSGDSREIVKIQVAASLPDMDKFPMLLYNESRTARTFIHAPTDEEDRNDVGYDRIRDLILSHGITGALSGGGTKGYFYARVTKRKGGQDIISIDVDAGLAPTQSW